MSAIRFAFVLTVASFVLCLLILHTPLAAQSSDWSSYWAKGSSPSCETSPPASAELPADSVRDATWIEFDPYEGATKVTAPSVKVDSSICAFLRGWIPSNGLPYVQLYVRARFHDWAFLDRAYRDGKMLDLVKITRKVKPWACVQCEVREDVGITLSPEDLEQIASEDWYDAKIAGSAGEVIIRIPSTYFAGFLARMEEAR